MKNSPLKTSLFACTLLAGVLVHSRAHAVENFMPPYSEPAAGEKVMSFFIQLPDHGVALTTGGLKGMKAAPDGIAPFSEPALENTLALITKMADADNNVIGFASELEFFPGDPTTSEIKWDTAWTLTLPGRGMIYLHQIEQSGGLGPNIVQPAMESGAGWSGSWIVTTTTGPLPSGRGRIIGGSGEFAGIKGSFVEIMNMTGFSAEGVMSGRVEIRLFVEE